jgi:multidrug resistance efflux pump
MKIRFDSSKERNPTHEQGLKVLYAPGKRTAFRLRWYLILVLVASPFLGLLAKLVYGAWVIEAPAQLILPMIEVRARDAARVERLAVKTGEAVQAKQLLLEMDNPELRQRLGQLHMLTNANANVLPREAPGTKLRGVLTQQLEQARRKLATMQQLRREGAATQGEVLEAARERDQREADLLAFDQRQESQRLQSAAAHDQTLHDQTLQKAEQVWLTDRLDALRLQASENAIVSEVFVTEGENVGSGTMLMKLLRTANPLIMIYLDPANDAYARPGQPLELELPDGHRVPATVTVTASEILRLPESLRLSFSDAPNVLQVSATVNGAIPPHWLVDRLPLKAHFPHDLSRLLR